MTVLYLPKNFYTSPKRISGYAPDVYEDVLAPGCLGSCMEYRLTCQSAFMLQHLFYTGVDVPRFNGSSYIVFPPLVTSRALVVSVEIRPESADGLLLYNGNEQSRFKDYVAIALTRRHIELRSQMHSYILLNVLIF